MAKNSIRDFDSTAANNTDIQSTDISEGCAASGINNAIRELMADIKDVSTGTVNLETPAADRLDVDNIRIDGNTISSTDTNGDITLDPDGTGAVVANSKIQFGSDAQTNITGGGASDVDLILSGDTNIRFETSTNEHMRIDSSGKVGIGTTSPARQLTVSNSGAALLLLESTGDDNGQLLFGDSANGTVGKVGYTHSTNHMFFNTNGSERMRIDSSGNVGIPSFSFSTAAGVFMNSAGRLLATCGGDSPLALSRKTNNGHIASFYRDTALIGNISITGSAVSFNTTSDHRTKENVADMTGAIARVKQLAPKRFNFISDADTTVDGFLAHEAQTVVPEAITGTHNEVDDDGNAVMQSIDQSKLVPLLTGALKEAIAKIETLETKVAALEAAE